MPKKTLISQEIIKSCVEKRLQGLSYIKIGKELGIDRRKVANIIRDHNKAEILREIGSARRDVAGEYMKEHLASLEAVGYYILGIVLPPYHRKSITEMPQNIEKELQTWLKAHPYPREGRVAITGNDLSQYKMENPMEVQTPSGENEPAETHDCLIDVQSLKSYLEDREASERIECLKAHLPSLFPLITSWEMAAGDYNKLLNEVSTGLEKVAIDLEMPEKLPQSELLDIIKLLYKNHFRLDGECFNQSRVASTKSKTVPQLLQNHKAVRLIKMLGSSLETLDQVFRKIEEILTPSRLRKSLLIGGCHSCLLSEEEPSNQIK